MHKAQKRIQVNVNRVTYEQAQAVLGRLDVSVSTVVNALLNRIATENRIPFVMDPDEEESVDRALSAAVAKANIPTLTGKDEVANYLLDDDY
ncbi:hypothetical protein [uncultured Lacticaseibacillus sp.]|uniref:hypothetical protein n=1 Tax=uncultured Lacticaseibacillus sp. TaxID=2775882 RepID=UPI0025958E6D|nr:hypothetical protein [uncultured Lacticaseibacillus sp.]